MDYKLSFLCTLVICFSLIESTVSLFSDVTSAVGFAGNIDGVTAAFGDFNADKKADIFVITKGKSSIEVYLWDTSKEEFQRSESAKIEVKTGSITNVIPGDFNGDGHLDVLVAYTQPRRKDETFVKVFLGKKSSFDEEITLQDTLKDQPAIVDFDGDLQPDLLGEKNSDTESSIYWWKYNHKKKSFEGKLISTKNQRPLSKPHSCGFLDLSGDFTPDIFIPTQTERASEGIIFEVWINKDGEFNVTSVSNKEYKPNFHFSKIGQSTFADLDSDGLADHLLPVYDKDGAKSEIRVYLSAEKKWVSILSNEKSQDFKWNFIPENFQDIIPFMTFRIGDYNLDGYPDAVAVVQEQKHSRKVVLLKNVECNGPTDCFHGRSFHIDHVISSIENPLVVGFFDLYEDGILDLIVVSSNDSASSYQIHAIKNNVYSDTCFLKVIVLGGSCFSSCPSGVTPYGVNQAGPYVKYITTGPGGDSKQASATQLSQSSYFALQPPYTVFGLGRTPNFVEKLIISLPRSKNSPVRRHTWTSIIPNSQVIIIPHPPDEPDEWKSKLLVTPSRLVLLTGGALLATCVFIGAIVAVLHWKEKREDRREKQEAAHKFHFDAM